MSINRLMANTCRECGTPITDGYSRSIRTGPDCRKGWSGEQIRAAAALTKQEADPAYIPPARAATVQARHTNAVARRTVEQATAPKVCDAHGGLVDKCPLCKRPNDAAQAAQMLAEQVARYLAQVHAERRAARDGATP